MPRRSNNGWWVVLVVLILLGSIAMGVFYNANRGNNGISYTNLTSTAIDTNATSTAGAGDTNATSTAAAVNATANAPTPTPTPYPPYSESVSPSGNTFNGDAQSIITNTQVASAINSSDQATTLQSTFNTGETIYMAYHANLVASNGTSWSGTVKIIWYFNGQTGDSRSSDYMDGTKYTSYDGYFSLSYSQPGQGAAEIYFCQTSTCWLAWVRPFKVQN
jgi:hypothetical protein